MNFADRLNAAVQKTGTPAVVGLDPRPDHFPGQWNTSPKDSPLACAEAAIGYHRELLDLLVGVVPMVKPQAAFFEQWGVEGYRAMATACQDAKDRGLLVLMDAKRGDIGSTASAYAEGYLGAGGFPTCDALTVNPYLGLDACEPFLAAADQNDAGLYFLVKTSNPGAELFQDHGTPTLAERVAEEVARWGAPRSGESGWSSIGAVVGATRPEELSRFRELMPNTPFLLPGFGFQGGTAEGLGCAFDQRGLGAVVNSSRGILWAHEREDLQHLPKWQDRVRAALQEMMDELQAVR